MPWGSKRASLRSRSGLHGDIVDAGVVVGAGARGDAIVTSDPRGLAGVAVAIGIVPPLHVV